MNAFVQSNSLIKHVSCITSVDIAPDGGVLTGAYDGLVIGRTSQQQAQWVVRLPDLVNSVSHSRRGHLVAAACADAHAYVLHARTGAILRRLGPHGDDVNAAIFTSDDTRLLTCCDDGDPLLREWSLHDGRVERTLHGHAGSVTSLSLSRDQRCLVTSGEDLQALVWDLRSGVVTHRLAHPADPETSALSHDDSLIATGANDGWVRLWGRDGNILLERFLGAAVRCVRFSDDRATLLAATYAGELLVLEVPDLATRHCLHMPWQWERSIAQRGDLLTLGSFGAQPALYRALQPQSVPEPTIGLNALTVSQGRVFAAGDAGRVFDVEYPHSPLHEHDTILNCLAVSSSGLCASGSYRGELLMGALKDPGGMQRTAVAGGPLNCMVWTGPDRLVTGSYDGQLREYDAQRRLLRSWQAHAGPVKSLAYDARSCLLFSASADSTIAAWRETDLVYRTSDAAMTLVNAVAIAPDAGLLVSASRDRRLRLWDLASGTLREALPCLHAKSAKAVAVDAAGSTIVSGAYDGQALVWRRGVDGWAAHSLHHHGRPGVSSVAMLGADLITAGWDGSVARWTEDAPGQWRRAQTWSQA